MLHVILTETGGTGMSSITSGATQAITFMTTAFEAMTGNVYLAVFLGVTMLGSGICLFRKLRRGT